MLYSISSATGLCSCCFRFNIVSKSNGFLYHIKVLCYNAGHRCDSPHSNKATLAIQKHTNITAKFAKNVADAPFTSSKYSSLSLLKSLPPLFQFWSHEITLSRHYLFHDINLIHAKYCLQQYLKFANIFQHKNTMENLQLGQILFCKDVNSIKYTDM